jgi:hypothetical protein
MKQETKKTTLNTLFDLIYLASLPLAIIFYIINL